MALPSSWDTRTIKGTRVDFLGLPASGKIYFTPTASRVKSNDTDAIIVKKSIVATLDNSGQFTITLPVSVGDTDVTPWFQYEVLEQINGVPDYSYNIEINLLLPSDTVFDIADLAPVGSVPVGTTALTRAVADVLYAPIGSTGGGTPSDGSVTLAKLANNSVDGSKIVDEAVGTAEIATGAVTGSKISDGAVDAAKLADGSVGTAKIADGAVTGAKIADGSVATAEIADSAVTGAKLANGTITAGKLASDSVDASKIVDGSVGTSELGAGVVTLAKMASNSVDGTKIVDGSIGTAEIADGAVKAGKISVFEQGVYLTEENFPGCSSDNFTTATAARQAAVTKCFIDQNDAVTTRPRPLVIPPNTRNSAAASGSIANMYSWNGFDFNDLVTNIMGITPSAGATVNLNWAIVGALGRDFYNTTAAIKTVSGQNAFIFPTTYNIGNFGMVGLGFTGRQNYVTTDDWFRPPGGRAAYDIWIENVGVQWYRYQLRGAFGRFTIKGENNFGNAAGQPFQLGGSDGVWTGVTYIDSRALVAGTPLVEFAGFTSFKVPANVYLTPHSALGFKFTGGCEGLSVTAAEVNGLTVRSPEACSDPSVHSGSSLLTGSPSIDPITLPGIIAWDSTSNSWVKSNGKAQNTGTGDGWSLYYDGSAAVTFNGMANRPATGIAGKVYQNIGAEPNGTAGTNPTISYWIYWQNMWHGPSYWNKASVPGFASGHTMTPVYVGCDGPGASFVGVRGSVFFNGSLKMVNECPGIVTNADGAIQVSDCYDTPFITAEIGQLGSGRRALAVASSGATYCVDVHAKWTTTKIPVGDTLLKTKTTGNTRIFRDGIWTVTKGSTETRANDSTPSDLSGLSVIVKAGEEVVIEGEIYVSSSGSPLGNSKWQWTTAGTDLTGRVVFDGLASGATGASSSRNAAVCITNGGGAVAIGVPNGNTQVIKVTGRLVGGTADSTWKIQCAQNTAVTTDTLTILSGSYITARFSSV